MNSNIKIGISNENDTTYIHLSCSVRKQRKFACDKKYYISTLLFVYYQIYK